MLHLHEQYIPTCLGVVQVRYVCMYGGPETQDEAKTRKACHVKVVGRLNEEANSLVSMKSVASKHCGTAFDAP